MRSGTVMQRNDFSYWEVPYFLPVCYNRRLTIVGGIDTTTFILQVYIQKHL